MNNITWGKDTAIKDNGERIMYWIPVKDRLPDNYQNGYLVTLSSGYTTTALWDFTKFTYNGEEMDVIAWMKLPEPYKI